jgi:hypothetical protein
MQSQHYKQASVRRPAAADEGCGSGAAAAAPKDKSPAGE